jgi:hypothetical protein
MSERDEHERGLLGQRDALLAQLRRDGVPGVISTALSRRDGEPVLEVLVRPGFRGQIPERFDGREVRVRRLPLAVAL